MNLDILLSNYIGIEDVQKYNKLPQLDLRGRMSWTGYIDFLCTTDMEYPIMWGYDMYNRIFISFRCKLVNTESFDDGSKSSTTSDKVVTVFQRYTDNNTLFVNNSVFYPVAIDTETWGKIRNLIITGNCQVNNTQTLYLNE